MPSGESMPVSAWSAAAEDGAVGSGLGLDVNLLELVQIRGRGLRSVAVAIV